MSAARYTGLLATLLATGSCRAPAPATEVLVVINSDLEVGKDVTELQVDVYDRSGKSPLLSQPLALSPVKLPAQFPLPLSFSLSPEPGVRDFRLVVTGRRAGPAGSEKVVEKQAIGAFRDGERLWMPIYLQRACAGQFCRAANEPLNDSTCDRGVCVPVPDAPLTPAGPGDLGPDHAVIEPGPKPDAGDELDAGDAGDAGDASAADARMAAEGGQDASIITPPPDAEVKDAGNDAGPRACGRWLPSGKDEPIPTGAVSYGVEYNDTAPGTFRQYVCRVRLSDTIVVPGKGVYGYSCYYISLDNTTQAASDTFEVLVDTADCAQMTLFTTALANGLPLLQTGTGASTEPLYSCVAVESSIGVMPAQPISAPLGRYDPSGKRCLFEWYNATRESSLDGNGQPTFSVLTAR